MGKFIDLTGKKFHRLTVIGRSPAIKPRIHWICVCECGVTKDVSGSDLQANHAKSCGCFNAENRRTKATTHGRGHGEASRRDKTYLAWLNMRRRCENPSAKGYSNYGGRGIKVCERWMKFENFLEDLGPSSDGLSLERLDVDGDYTPSNCAWASIEAQSNNKRTTLVVKVDGERMSAMQAARLLKAPYEKVRWAIHRYGDNWIQYVRAAAALGKGREA